MKKNLYMCHLCKYIKYLSPPGRTGKLTVHYINPIATLSSFPAYVPVESLSFGSSRVPRAVSRIYGMIEK